MVQRLPLGYVFDPADPRAPSTEQWERMSADERASVVAMLPPDLPLDMLPNEGDPHRKAKHSALDALDGFFRRTDRKIYISSELAVYYPDERRFAPDLIAVTDVEPHERTRWVVTTEGKGLDFVLEVHASGDRRKDEVTNVERYARLGIPEYFYFDRTALRLSGYRLPHAGARAYQRLVPQGGRFQSQVLGLDLALEGKRLRFFAGNAALDDAEEQIVRLGAMLDKVIAGQEEAAQKLADEQQRREEAERERDEAKQRSEEAERALAEALAEIARLKQGKS
jgi:Uma2 family endonuclease